MLLANIVAPTPRIDLADHSLTTRLSASARTCLGADANVESVLAYLVSSDRKSHGAVGDQTATQEF
jgi:hypothetical protein